MGTQINQNIDFSGWSSLEPRPFEVHPTVLSYLPAVVAELVGTAIAKVEPKVRVGRVEIYHVFPSKQASVSEDEVPLSIIWAKGIDLSNYYSAWGRWVTNQYAHTDLYALMDKLIEPIIRNIMDESVGVFEVEEQKYLYMNLLQWKLDIRRSR